MIGEVVFGHLSTFAGLVSLVGTRIYPDVAPDKATKPYVTYQVVSGGPDYDHGGANGYANPLVQVDGWSTSSTERDQIGAQLLEAFKTMNGVIASVNIGGALVEDERTGYEPDTKLFRYSADVRILKNG